MKKATVEKIIKFFEENEDIFNECVADLDSYNGYLGDDRYYSMDELNELYAGVEPMEVLYRAYYGHDADTWTVDNNGNKVYGEFNPNRDYFKYNGYGNLISTDYIDYSDHLDQWVIESLSDNRYYINAIDDNNELRALFDELEEDDEQ